MEVLYIFLLSLGSITVLFIITKLMGYRQISEMSFFDYVVGISIGSIAAEMATNIDLEWWKGVLAMAIYGAVGIILSVITQKSINARKFISGSPIVLIDKGKINKESLKKAKIEVDDLLTSARGNGYFNISDIEYAIMETTGKISFLPTAQKRQLNPTDFKLTPEYEGLCVNVIIDGRVIKKDLKYANITLAQLEGELKKQKVSQDEVLLATVDTNKKVTIFKK